MAKWGEIFGGSLIGLGLALDKIRAQRQQESLQAAQLLSKQGTFSPVEQSAVPDQGFLGNLFGVLPQNYHRIGGQAFGYTPYPEVEIPGFGKMRVEPGDAMKMWRQQQENEGNANFYNALVRPGPGIPQRTTAAPPAPALPPGLPVPPTTPPVRPAPGRVPPVPTDPRMLQRFSRYEPTILAASQKYGVDPLLIKAVMAQESGGVPEAVSPKGAIGLMQLMPQTAADLGVDPYDPVQNIMGGTRYIKQQLDQFGGDQAKALAAYNAGPTRASSDRPLPPETRAYVPAVQGRYQAMGGQPPVTPSATPVSATDQRAIGQITAIDEEIGRLEAMLAAQRGPKAEKRAEVILQRLTPLIARRDKLEDSLDEVSRAVLKERATGEVRLEQDITKERVLGPIKSAQTVKEREQVSDVMSDADKLIAQSIPGTAGKVRYSQLSPEQAQQMREAKADMGIDTFVARTTASAEIMDRKQRSAKRDEAMIDLKKTEAVVNDIYDSWKSYTAGANLAERGKAAIQLRRGIAGFGGALGRLVDRGVLTDQDRAKAEGMLPGILEGAVSPATGEEAFKRVRGLLGSWRSIITDTYGASGVSPATTPTQENRSDLLPAAKDYTGATIEDMTTKKKYRSDGTTWTEVQ